MKAYRVKLMGTNDTYLVTERQKAALDKAIEGKGTIVHIGGDTLRTSAIKAISAVNIDLDSCPDYFTEVVKREEASSPQSEGPGYQKLPTEWIILDLEGKILATNIGRIATKQIAANLAPEGKHFRQANCHYRIGTTGDREYITNLTMIPEAIEYRPSAEGVEYSAIVDRWKYGQRQW